MSLMKTPLSLAVLSLVGTTYLTMQSALVYAEKPRATSTAKSTASRPKKPSPSNTQSTAVTSSRFLAAHSDFFNLLYPDDSQFKFRYLFQPTNKASDGPGEFDIHQFSLIAEAPFPLSRNLYYRFGLEYGAQLYDFDRVAQARTMDNSDLFHKVVANAGAGLFLTDNLLITGVAQPGMYSDFNNGLNTQDFKLFWNGLFVYRLNHGAQLLAGAAYNEVFDDAPLIPLIGVRLQGEDGKLQIALTAPLELRVAYNTTPRVQFYAGYWISGDEFRVNIGEPTFNAQVQERRLGGGVVYWFGQHWNMNVEAGVSLASRLKFKVADAGQFSGELDPTGYVAAGVGVGL